MDNIERPPYRKVEMGDVVVISNGPLHCSVCVHKDLTPHQIEAETNRKNPTGISSKWVVSKEKKFRTGEPNPCPCEKHPETRKHYLMVC